MDYSSILKELGKTTNRVMGQHFLTDSSVVDKMIKAARISPEDFVVEIGSGLGILTRQLAESAKQVIAIEKDRELCAYLQKTKARNVKLFCQDALIFNWQKNVLFDYKIVANLPYQISSPLLRKIFGLPHFPKVIVVMVQWEVGLRLIGAFDSNERGYLTVLREAYGEIELIKKVKPSSFYPQPKVESAIIKITPHTRSFKDQINWLAVQAGFRHRRQTLANALHKDLAIPKSILVKALNEMKLSEKIRAQELNFDSWRRLSMELKSAGSC